MKHMTFKEFFKHFPDDQTCLDHLFNIRYGFSHKCRKCDRNSRFYRVSSQRAYACQFCGDHVYPCVGTPFESSRTSLQTWFYAIYLFATTRHGVSAKELQRQLGVTYKCAWRIGHEIRKHMADVDGETPLNGEIEVDETFVGGHKEGSYGGRGKAIVFGMLDRDGDVVMKVVPNRQGESLVPLIEQHVEKGSTVYSDFHSAYEIIKDKGYTHKRINHSHDEYVRGRVHINTIENFWFNLKRGIAGTHIHVSKKHLENYVKEFEYRYNSRKNPNQMIFDLLTVFAKP